MFLIYRPIEWTSRDHTNDRQKRTRTRKSGRRDNESATVRSTARGTCSLLRFRIGGLSELPATIAGGADAASPIPELPKNAYRASDAEPIVRGSRADNCRDPYWPYRPLFTSGTAVCISSQKSSNSALIAVRRRKIHAGGASWQSTATSGAGTAGAFSWRAVEAAPAGTSSSRALSRRSSAARSTGPGMRTPRCDQDQRGATPAFESRPLSSGANWRTSEKLLIRQPTRHGNSHYLRLHQKCAAPSATIGGQIFAAVKSIPCGPCRAAIIMSPGARHQLRGHHDAISY
jgi:hypothetical protein